MRLSPIETNGISVGKCCLLVSGFGIWSLFIVGVRSFGRCSRDSWTNPNPRMDGMEWTNPNFCVFSCVSCPKWRARPSSRCLSSSRRQSHQRTHSFLQSVVALIKSTPCQNSLFVCWLFSFVRFGRIQNNDNTTNNN